MSQAPLNRTSGRWKIEGSVDTLAEAVQLDQVSSLVFYVGKAVVGSLTSNPVWKISRNTSTTGGNLVVEYANGSSSYTNIWDNRTSLSYS